LPAEELAHGCLEIGRCLCGRAGLAKVEGFVSLEFFRKFPSPLTTVKKCYSSKTNVGLKKRLSAGVSIPIQVSRKTCFDQYTMPLSFSNAASPESRLTPAAVPSFWLGIHERFAIDRENPDVKTVKGIDETGHAYVRYFTTLRSIFFSPVQTFSSGKTKGPVSKTYL